MDEHEFRDEMLRLAKPISATPLALDAVAERVKTKRRVRILGAAVAGGLAVAVGFAGISLATHSQTTGPVGEPNAVNITTYVNERGVRFTMTAVFSEDRDVDGGQLQVGSVTAAATLYADDGSDPEGGPDVPLSLPAGVPVLVEATAKPSCDEATPDPLEFTISSRLANGESTTDEYPISNTDQYASAYRIWCGVGVGIQVGGGGVEHGDAGVFVRIVNSTSEDVTVEMPALESDGAQWDALMATVPAGSDKYLSATGHGVHCGLGQAVPWQRGRMLIDGVPYDVPVSDTWTC